MSNILLVYVYKSGPSLPLLTFYWWLKWKVFLKSLCKNVLFGNIDRKIGQAFPWGIKTLTFPPKEWGAEPTPHCRVIYSYIHKFFLERAPQWYVVVLKRAPQYRVLENGQSFRLGIYLTILGILCEFAGWQLLISLYYFLTDRKRLFVLETR